MDNLANAFVGIEYAKYTKQDVLIMQVDIEKVFDTVQCDFIVQTMEHLGFGAKMRNAVYFLCEK